MLVRRGGTAYTVEVKSAPEGRSDRLIPLWSQACIQAVHAAGGGEPPLAVVAAPRVSSRVAEQVLEFSAEYAPHVAAGVVDFSGFRRFRGKLLEELNSAATQRPALARRAAGDQVNIFSDRNQWMLKVLLAPEVPEAMLAAPRARYSSASHLARAASVSVMSASRLVRQLEREGHLHEASPYLRLVRREELFRRWQSAAARPVSEAPFRFLLRGDSEVELKRTVLDESGCLALFAAADALNVGFVRGVPPHVYVRRLDPEIISRWKNVVPAERNEAADLIIREAAVPDSVFRAAVRVDSIPVCDILQVWLDVSSHPTRGQEQADLIRRKILEPIISNDE